VDIAEVAAAAVGVVPTSALRKALCRLRGLTMDSNSIASATKAKDHTAYVGVMAQQVQKIEPSAVWRDRDGYLVVNYDRIGLKFMTWREWLERTRSN
jgi:hypothetical protein